MNYQAISETLHQLLFKKTWLFLPAFFFCLSLSAGDDVYDAATPRTIKVRKTYTAPQETERTVPYNEEDNSSAQRSTTYNNEQNSRNDNYSNNNYSNDDYSNDGFGSGYSDRIRRFHNPSIRYSYGMSFNSDPFYDPFYSYNSFAPYSFTPSGAYGYNDFYNPFWGGSQVLIVNDPFMSYYNPGFYNPYCGYNYYSPSCAAIVYNNYPYSGYYGGGYYDGGRKNVVYGPRTGGYNNTNHSGYGNSNYNSSSNSSSAPAYQNNQAPSKKWNRSSNPSQAPANNNVYRYNQQNNQNNTPRETPAQNNNNWGNNRNNGNQDGGIRIGTRPK